ncbi:hypothetical protein Tco_1287893, partial [Tanacetum coccineum]
MMSDALTGFKFFKLHDINTQGSERPNDEERDTSNVEGNRTATSDACNFIVDDEVEPVATQIGDSVTSEGNVSVIYLCFATTLNKYVELKTYYEASQNPHWVEAMNLETKDLHRNNTWVLFDLLMGRKPIWCKWIYKIRYKSTGEVNSCAEYVKSKKGQFIALLAYVDDIVITGFGKQEWSLFFPKKVIEHIHSILQSYLKQAPRTGIQFLKVHVVVRSYGSLIYLKIWELRVCFQLNHIVVELYSDSSATIQIGANPDFHEKPKHFELDVLLVREKVSSGVIKTMKVSSASRYIYQSCDYSSQFWQLVKKKVEVVNNGKDRSTIVNGFATMKNGNSIRSVIRRPCLAASIYLIWQERNARLFKDEKRNVDDLFRNLVEIVTLRLSSLKVKRSKEVHKIED